MAATRCTTVASWTADCSKPWGRAAAEGPPAGAGGAPGRLTAEEALWALCWRTIAALNEVLVRTTRDSKIVLLGELYPRLVDTCIDGVAERAHGAPRTH